jgi:hypothetical protein
MAEIEDFIRGYRPLDPPPDLRERVVHLRTRRSRRTWLLIAASAFLAITCQGLSIREHSMLTEALIARHVSLHEQQVRALARRLGNDEAAVVQAELILAIDEEETSAP